MADLTATIAEAIKNSGFSVSGTSTHPSLELAQHIAKAIEQDLQQTHVYAVDTCVEDGVYLFASYDDAKAFHAVNEGSHLSEEPIYDHADAVALLEADLEAGS